MQTQYLDYLYNFRGTPLLYDLPFLCFRVNNYFNAQPQTPFGGYKMSGNGREL